MSQLQNGEKKRKRLLTGSADQSNKISKPSAAATVSMVPAGSDNLPVLATSSGITVPKQASFQSYRKSHKNTHELLLHSGDHPRLNYTGREAARDVEGNALKHYIGVYDPTTNTVKVTEARGVSVKSSLKSEDEEMLQQELQQKQALSLQRRALGQEFGTKKAKKAINAITENAVTSFTARGADAKEIAKAIRNDEGASATLASLDTSHPTREEEQKRMQDHSVRPDANLNAESPADVYTLRGLIGQELLTALKVKSWIEAVEDDEAVEVGSKFVQNRLAELVKRNADDMIPRVKALKFILLCIIFAKSSFGGRQGRKFDLKKLSVSDHVEEDAWKEFKRRFMKDNMFMSKSEFNRVLTHIAATALLVDDLALDMHDLKEDLGMDQKTLQVYFAQVGAKVRSMRDGERQRLGLKPAEASVHKIAELKLPLEFPTARVIPMARGRR